jgi:hypothetical protein
MTMHTQKNANFNTKKRALKILLICISGGGGLMLKYFFWARFFKFSFDLTDSLCRFERTHTQVLRAELLINIKITMYRRARVSVCFN